MINKEGDKSNHEVYSSSPTLPSLLAWGEWDYYMVSGDTARLARVMLPLIKFYEWFQRYQRRASGHYYCEQIAHSSWEIPADVYQALAARALSMMADTVGRPDLAEYFRKEYDDIAAMMNRDYWDDKNSFYNARLADGGFETEPEPGRIYKYVRSFDTLMAGLAPRDRAEHMIRQMLDPRGFMGQYGVRSLSVDSTIWIVDTVRYLNAESENEIPGTYPFKKTVWPPNMVSALRSLDAYGYTEESAEFAERYARALAVICRDYHDITEFAR